MSQTPQIPQPRLYSAFTTLVIIASILVALVLVTAVAFSGILGTNFAISWLIDLIAGGIIAYGIVKTFRYPLIILTVGVMALFVGLALFISQIVPDLGLILTVAGAFSIVMGFTAESQKGNIRGGIAGIQTERKERRERR